MSDEDEGLHPSDVDRAWRLVSSSEEGDPENAISVSYRYAISPRSAAELIRAAVVAKAVNKIGRAHFARLSKLDAFVAGEIEQPRRRSRGGRP